MAESRKVAEQLAAFRQVVRPTGWTNPAPKPSYDLVVIGGGAAGLAAVEEGVALGASVALVEADRLGGGGVGGGGLTARVLAEAAQGLAGRGAAAKAAADPVAMLARVRELRQIVAARGGAGRLTLQGVDLFFGQAKFASPGAVILDSGTTLAFGAAVLATGAKAVVPTFPGLGEGVLLLPESLPDLETLPRRVVVLGAGDAGCELAQSLARLGVEVSLLDTGPRVLPNGDPDVSEFVRLSLESDGVAVRTGIAINRVLTVGAQVGVGYTGAPGSPATADRIVVALGRTPSIGALGLEAAGIRFDRSGVQVDARLRTKNANVYAAGACLMPEPGRQAPEVEGRLAARNALKQGKPHALPKFAATSLLVDPPVARVGLDEATAAARRVAVEVVKVPLADADPLDAGRRVPGFAKVLLEPGLDVMVGATIAGPGAEGAAAQVALAMSRGLGIGTFNGDTAAAPSTSQVLARLADLSHRRSSSGLGGWLARKLGDRTT